MKTVQTDIIVIGGGHAGAEAAWAAANLGAGVVLVTLDPDKIGVMSCNPAIGGLAKGQIVREIDALGGLMGRAADRAGIQFRLLNTSKGPAVQGPRAQCDRHAYARAVHDLLASRTEITILAASCDEILSRNGKAVGVACTGRTDEQMHILADAVILTTGTFMRGLMHTGPKQTPGGRYGEKAASSISASLRKLGFQLGRLKTGTPPRLRKQSIAWDSLPPQYGDALPLPFSDITDPAVFPLLEQVECRMTSTTPEAHALIEKNLHRAPMYSGQIKTVGPRYCPSIEDKIVRFPDRTEHHVFLEPESHSDDLVYCNGISTSLPVDVQQAVVHMMPGCENAEIVRFGYAIEYDMVQTHQLDSTCMSKRVEGLFLAGQINGTSGYEEAAGQGLVAGLNAVRFARGQEMIRLARDEAYIGVMLDDLTLKNPVEPYRMFTSRAEHRLLLRADNAADRLTPKARQWGLVGEDQWQLFQERQRLLQDFHQQLPRIVIDGKPLRSAIHQRDFDLRKVAQMTGNDGQPAGSVTSRALFTAVADLRYEGYLAKERAGIRRARESEHWRLPADFDYQQVIGLRNEARYALERFRPATLGQAGRLEGVNPADVTILAVALKRMG